MFGCIAQKERKNLSLGDLEATLKGRCASKVVLESRDAVEVTLIGLKSSESSLTFSYQAGNVSLIIRLRLNFIDIRLIKAIDIAQWLDG